MSRPLYDESNLAKFGAISSAKNPLGACTSSPRFPPACWPARTLSPLETPGRPQARPSFCSLPPGWNTLTQRRKYFSKVGHPLGSSSPRRSDCVWPVALRSCREIATPALEVCPALHDKREARRHDCYRPSLDLYALALSNTVRGRSRRWWKFFIATGPTPSDSSG